MSKPGKCPELKCGRKPNCISIFSEYYQLREYLKQPFLNHEHFRREQVDQVELGKELMRQEFTEWLTQVTQVTAGEM